MKTVATVQICEQVSQNDWQLISYHKQLDDSTTMKELKDWALSKCLKEDRTRENFTLPEIRITVLE